MKAPSILLVLVALGALATGAPAQAASLDLPASIRRGEPAIVSLVGAAGEPSGYRLALRYADGKDGPAYIGFRAPGTVSGGRQLIGAGALADETRNAVFFFLIAVPVDAALGDAAVVAFSYCCTG